MKNCSFFDVFSCCFVGIRFGQRCESGARFLLARPCPLPKRGVIPFLRNGIMPMSAPGMATPYAPYCEIEPSERAMFAEGFDGIVAAGRIVPAGRGEQGRNGDLIKSHEPDEYVGKYFQISSLNRRKARRISRSISLKLRISLGLYFIRKATFFPFSVYFFRVRCLFRR